jgi:hypothetical protein
LSLEAAQVRETLVGLVALTASPLGCEGGVVSVGGGGGGGAGVQASVVALVDVCGDWLPAASKASTAIV